MSKKLAGILVILCIIGILVVAGARFVIPAETPPVGPAVTPSPETTTATPTPETPAPGVNITEAEAKMIAAAALPEIVRAETAKVRLEHLQDGRGEHYLFEVSDRSNSTKQAQVWVDARTGEVTDYVIHTPNQGRPTDPVITVAEACASAEKFLADRGETADLAAAVGYYTPHTAERTGETVAGHYLVDVSRSIRGVPCFWDGYLIDVDAVTGDIRRCFRCWDLDAAQCKSDIEPMIAAGEAEEMLGTYLRETHGDLPGLVYHSTTLVWADNLVSATGEVPLAWEIKYDDDHYRSREPPRTDIAFVDARNGTVLSCNYHHFTD